MSHVRVILKEVGSFYRIFMFCLLQVLAYKSKTVLSGIRWLTVTKYPQQPRGVSSEGEGEGEGV